MKQSVAELENDNQCRLTVTGHDKLEERFRQKHPRNQSTNFLAGIYELDNKTLRKLRRREGWTRLRNIQFLFDALGLCLDSNDFEHKTHCHDACHVPNPFEESDLWGCDELLRQIFEQLGKGGSQALIGPAGCGKSEILRQIQQQGAAKLNRAEQNFLYIDMHGILDMTGFFDELGDLLNFGTVEPNQIRRHLVKSGESYVLSLDSIHVLQNETFFPETTRNWLRSMAETPGTPLQLVITSQRNLRQLFPDRPSTTSPLADFFAGQTMTLNYWDFSRVQQFVLHRLQSTDIDFPLTEISVIWEKSQGQPKRVRELARDLYEEYTRR